MTQLNTPTSAPAFTDREKALLDQLDLAEKQLDQDLKKLEGPQDAFADALGNLKTADSSEAAADNSGTPAASQPGEASDPPQDQHTQDDPAGLTGQSDGQDPEQSDLATDSGLDESQRSEKDKAKAREARAWKKIQEQKAEQERRQLELAEREMQLAERERKLSEAPKAQEQESQFTEADYERAIETFTEREDWKTVEIAQQQLAELRARKAKEATPPEPQAVPKMAAEEFAKQSREHAQALREQFPAYADKNSPEFQALNEAAQKPENAFLLEQPQGLRALGTHIAYQRQAARVPELEAKVKELTDKIATLEADTLPSGLSSSATTTAGRSFDDLPVEEMQKEIERMVGAARG